MSETFTWLPEEVPTPPVPPTPGTAATSTQLHGIVEPFRNSRSFPIVFCEALAVQLAELREAFLPLGTLLNISAQSGETLDMIGRILGRPRAGLVDDDYKVILIAQQVALNSHGTIADFLQLFDLLTPTFGGEPVSVVAYYPKMIIITLHSPFTGNINVLVSMLRFMKEAGTNLQLMFTTSELVDTFTFAGGAGKGFGEGHLSGVVKT